MRLLDLLGGDSMSQSRGLRFSVRGGGFILTQINPRANRQRVPLVDEEIDSLLLCDLIERLVGHDMPVLRVRHVVTQLRA